MDTATRAADFASRVLRMLLSEWQASEPAARLGEGPEPLHKLRVTGHRMDTVLCLFRRCLPAGLVRGRPLLKSLVDALGGVRDLDVRLQAVSTFRNSLPERDRHTLDPLLRHLQSERARARAAMLRALDANPAREWLDTLPDQLARAAAATAPDSPRNAAALIVVPKLISRRYRKLRKCARRLTSESSIREFHEVRIRAKKLRYALEIVAPTYAGRADEMLARLRKLQSKLGTQRDADVVARYLEQLATHPPADFTRATVFMMGRMAQLNTAAAARMSRRIEKPWRKIGGKRWKALRARMRGLRGRARKLNRKVSAVDRYGAGGNGRRAGTNANGNSTGEGANRRLLRVGLAWHSPHPTWH